MQNVKQFTVVRNGITFILFLFLPLFGVMIHSSEVKAKPFAYVTNELDDTVSVIDTANNKLVDTDPGTPGIQGIPVGDFPQGVAITPDGSRAYVANKFDDTVSVIDTANNNLVDTDPLTIGIQDIPVGGGPNGVAITPDGSRVYVTNQFSDTVSVIDTDPSSPTFNKVVKTIKLAFGSSPLGVAITTPDGKRAYVATAGFGSLLPAVKVIDTDPSSPTFNAEVATVPGENGPTAVAVTPGGSFAYVTDIGFSLFGIVSVIDTDPSSPTFNKVVKTINLVFFDFPFGVAITPDGSRAYVANQFFGTVPVIDTDPTSPDFNTVVDTVPVESFPTGVAIKPDGKRVYVANNGADTVSVINTSSNIVVDTVSVGSGPFWVAITPDAGTGDFASFTIEKARVKLGKKPDTDRFEVRGWFELGAESDGIDVLNEGVKVSFNGFPEETIPAGSFFRGGGRDGGKYEFKGPSGGITRIKIKIEEDGVIEFRVKARGLDLGTIDLTSSVPFSLQIGDNLGETVIPFDKKGHFRE